MSRDMAKAVLLLGIAVLIGRKNENKLSPREGEKRAGKTARCFLCAGLAGRPSFPNFA